MTYAVLCVCMFSMCVLYMFMRFRMCSVRDVFVMCLCVLYMCVFVCGLVSCVLDVLVCLSCLVCVVVMCVNVVCVFGRDLCGDQT